MANIKTQKQLDAERAKNAEMKQRHQVKKAELEATLKTLRDRDTAVQDAIIKRTIARHEEDREFQALQEEQRDARVAVRHGRRRQRLAVFGRKAK